MIFKVLSIFVYVSRQRFWSWYIKVYKCEFLFAPMWHFPIRNPAPAKSTFFGVNGEMKFTK